MSALNYSQLWVNYAGTSKSRRAVGRLVGVELLALSIGFLLQLDILLPYPVPGLLFIGFVVAPGLYAGWKIAGVVASVIGVWLPLVWASVIPPLIGVLIGSNTARYNHIRFLGVEYGSPFQELTYGLEYAATDWFILAAIVGSISYLVGGLGQIAHSKLGE